jgi:uncharacterized spore protein YtfJ
MAETNFVDRVAQLVQLNVNAKQVYGEPIERDGLTIIPVARVQWGFGGGGIGRGPGERGGGGGGGRAHPAGYIELKNGVAEYRPVRHPTELAALAIVGVAGVLLGLLVARSKR